MQIKTQDFFVIMYLFYYFSFPELLFMVKVFASSPGKIEYKPNVSNLIVFLLETTTV